MRLQRDPKLWTLRKIVKMNSTNWPAPNVLVFIAQLVEHCRINGSRPFFHGFLPFALFQLQNIIKHRTFVQLMPPSISLSSLS